MKDSLLSILFFITLLAFVAAGFVFDTAGHAARPLSQESQRSLDIERYVNEPLELVELKIGDEPVKDKIISKYRRNDEGIDNVSFNGKTGWFKGLLIRLRNVSGRPIYGVSALLYFQPPSTRTRFSLPLTASTEAKLGVLEPKAEITFAVSDQAWNLTSNTLRQHGVDVDQATVKFSIEIVRFSEDLLWRNGHLHRRDPNNRDKWNIIYEKATP